MKSVHTRLAASVLAAISLAGCIGPMGPTAPVPPPPPLAPPMPGPVAGPPGPMSSDFSCRQYADAQTAPMRSQANVNTVGSTLVGAGLGAALGAAVGGGRGAGIGAASGAILGTGYGAANAQNAAFGIQQQYNMFYSQCMSAQSMPAQSMPGQSGGLGAPVPPPPPYR